MDTRRGVRVRVWPSWMYHDVYFWGDYEPYHTKIYERIVRPGQTVFDVGANFGWYTTLFARWVQDTGAVHAFEPVPFIHQLTQETISLNGVASNVHLNQLALGGRHGSLTMRTYAGLPHGHATAVDLRRADAETHVVEVTTLDAYCAARNIESIDFMKVDVEGFEPDVFEGGRHLLSFAGAPVVAFEINADCLQARSLGSADVLGRLRECGYEHFFMFSVRRGVRRLESDHLEHGNCIAAKTDQLGRLALALRTGRVLA